MTVPIAEVIAVGDELTHGHGIDTNSAFIARALEDLGLSVRRFVVVGDRTGDLEAVLREATRRASVVVATGGLGPTEDDRTRHAAAAAAGVRLAFHEPSWEWIGSWFRRRQRPLSDSNRRQALLPEGAEALENRWGTAPGFCLEIGDCLLFALPGVPREMREMLAAYVLPCVAREVVGARPLASHALLVLGVTEAELGERIADFMRPGGDVEVGVTAHFGLLTVRIAAHAGTAALARELCLDTAARLRPRIGKAFLCEGVPSLLEDVGQRLIEGCVTVATAESCTGGLLASRLTGLPGISAVLLAGWVTYSDAAKARDLGVPQRLLAEHGAVSEPVVAAMAAGAARRAGARLGLAVSGVAGPSGGTAQKPVGSVCFGLHLDGETASWRLRVPPISREFVRERAVIEILAAVRRKLAP